jgi:APA family basic amino acid/polyamine antiporter
MKRWLGVPFLYAAASAAVGFSIYFSIGVVADRGLGLTPVIFLLAGLMFALTSLSYVEGGAMLRERGGSATFARHAFNELISFIAGWAILIDYLIVIAAAAITVSHYLTPISGQFGGGDVEFAVAALVIVLAAILNIADITGRNRQRRLVVLSLAELALQLLVIVVGLIVVMHPERLTDHLDLFNVPDFQDIVYSLVIATIAYAGIEAASDLAPDLEFEPADLKRVLGVGAIAIPLIYAGIAVVALMAVPVEPTPHGPQTALAHQYIEEPILGVVANYDHGFLSDFMKWAVMLVAVPVLFWAANTAMLGLSRHVYVLATNRQIPSWAGKLESNYSTPYIAIGIAAVLALVLAIPGNIRFLASVYAFGALLAVTIAQISIVRLRIVEPNLERPYRVPWNVRIGGQELPVLAMFGAAVSALAWISVFVLHHTAVWVGGGWMLFGLVFYVIYRRYVEGTPLTRRVQVPEASLKKQATEAEYSTILVPVFGTNLDDDIVSTAGRLADASVEDGERPPRLDVVFVAELPLTVPLDAPLPRAVREDADRALERAREVGDEYENVEVTTNLVPARSTGSGIIQEARERGAEVIVMGGEPPTRVRGGAILGGIGGARPDEIGEVTEYVLKKAPCRVLLTAPPEDEPAREEPATASPSNRGHERPPDATARGSAPRS